jgi:cystathionine beta-lyase/cystathionine gamma-synthase
MMHLSSILNSLAEDRQLYYNAMSPPVMQTSNFTFKTVDEFAKAAADEYSRAIYTKATNPTSDILRKKLAALDGAEDCLVVNSGSTAIFISVLSQVSAGDHIIAVKGVYNWAQKMFNDMLPRFNVQTTWIDGANISNFVDAVRPNTRLIYLESPTSWVFEEQDLPAVAAFAKSKNITTIIDNTYYTPLYQRPIADGIDIAIQSASKYIGGHSDTIGGVISASAGIVRQIYHSEFLNAGAAIMPFNAWLLLRGLRTLPLRLDRIQKTTAAILAFLRSHPAVEDILMPKNGFGLFTIILNVQSRGSVVRFCEALNHFSMAVSWGGHESLVMPKCATVPESEFAIHDRIHRSVRVYVGLEDSDLLINDMEQALNVSGYGH